MKLREFWIVPDPSNTWRNKPPYEVENIIHVREVAPAFDDKVKMLVSAIEKVIDGPYSYYEYIDKEGRVVLTYKEYLEEQLAAFKEE